MTDTPETILSQLSFANRSLERGDWKGASEEQSERLQSVLEALERHREWPPHEAAPLVGEVTNCTRCGGEGCPHCDGGGRVIWVAYGKSRPYSGDRL